MNTTQLSNRLEILGFDHKDDTYRRNGFNARLERRWLTFEKQTTSKRNLPEKTVGGPGFWKNVSSPDGHLKSVFDLPIATISDQEVWDEESGDRLYPLDEMIDWVNATQSGQLKSAWNCPPREELEKSLPDKIFTLEVGRFARQGKLTCGDQRLSVSMPLTQRIPVDLPPQRRLCLNQLLADIQDHSRLVRFDEQKTEVAANSIWAEVDLTGAPRFALPLLLRIGLDAVRHIVSQNISTVELLVDPTVTSTVWDIPSEQDHPAERSLK